MKERREVEKMVFGLKPYEEVCGIIYVDETTLVRAPASEVTIDGRPLDEIKSADEYFLFKDLRVHTRVLPYDIPIGSQRRIHQLGGRHAERVNPTSGKRAMTYIGIRK